MSHRLLSLLIVAFAALPCTGQTEQSLTDEFAKLSAKERARIAKEELEESARDTHYQALMEEAEALFRTKDFEGSLEKYKEARELRPYNVYPKVKIQDLQALLKRMEEEAKATPEEPEERPAPRVEAPVVKSSPTVPEAIVEQPAAEPQRQVIRPAETPQRPRDPEVKVAVVPPSTGPKPEADPVEAGERLYREGRATVLERRVLEDGKPIVWRKVTHPWGEVVHFRDGQAIPARTWTDRFGGQ